MPLYAYNCGADGIFETYASHDDSYMDCPVCHQPARRRPFSGVPNLKGETVAKSIPDPHYRQEAQKRELTNTWGDGTRSMELIRSHVREDKEGRKFVDTPAISRES